VRILAPLLMAVALVTHAHAQSPLLGTWSVAIDGQPLVVTFENGGTGKVNGTPMKWQTFGQLLFVQQQGQQAVTYSFQAQGDKLNVGGGDLNGTVTLTRGTAAADAAKKQQAAAAAKELPAAAGGNGQELVGKWCKMTTFTANSGGSQRSTCFELKADGTYTYRHESSMSGNTGGTASQSADAGRWKVAGNQLTAQSRSGSVNTYTLEKRNHPKNKRDPMICLNGECYVTFYNKPAW
jgi:hypothetical protein